MEDGGTWERNLFLLAVVIISLIRWIVNSIRERNSASRMEEEEDDYEYEFEKDERNAEQATPPQWQRDPQPSARGRSSEPQGQDLAGELRKFFDTLEEKTAPTSRVPSPAGGYPIEEVEVLPPPLPVETSETPAPARPKTAPASIGDRPSLSKAEREALEKLRRTGSLEIRGSRKTSHYRSMAARMLQSPEGLRDAFVLKEILDAPKAMREN